MSSSIQLHQKGTTVKKVLAFVAFIVMLLGFSGTAQAFADTTNQPTAGQVVYSESDSSSHTSDHSIDYGNTQSSGKIVLADMFVAPDKSTRTHKVTCQTWKSGYNSGRHANGKTYSFLDHNLRVCPSKASPSGWVKVGGGKTGRNCGNVVYPVNRKPAAIVPAEKVVLVKYFSNVSVTVHAVASAVGNASSTASCSANGATASATAYGRASGFAEAFATGTAKTVEQARRIATSKISTTELSTSASGSAFAAALADVATHATAFCSSNNNSTPPPITYSCPPGSTSTTDSTGTTRCVKDGSTTPPPQQNPQPGGTSTPPGQNPPPSGGTGDPGSHQCYDPNTGQPVAPGTPGAYCS